MRPELIDFATFERGMRSHGFSLRAKYVLFHLSRSSHQASHLAELSGCTPSNMTGIIDQLEYRGLVQRNIAVDRRLRTISLTVDGLMLVVEAIGRKAS